MAKKKPKKDEGQSKIDDVVGCCLFNLSMHKEYTDGGKGKELDSDLDNDMIMGLMLTLMEGEILDILGNISKSKKSITAQERIVKAFKVLTKKKAVKDRSKMIWDELEGKQYPFQP